MAKKRKSVSDFGLQLDDMPIADGMNIREAGQNM